MALPLLTQSELVEELAEETGWSKSDVRRFLDGLDTVITSNVSDGYRVKISGVVIGPVVASARKARTGRNPQTGEPVKIKATPAKVKIKAKIVKPLSDVTLPSVNALERMM
jgi:DNA-binding protein HU-beta